MIDEIGAVACDHQADQSEAPQQDKGKNTEPGEDQPSQQRAPVTEGIEIRIRRCHLGTSTST